MQKMKSRTYCFRCVVICAVILFTGGLWGADIVKLQARDAVAKVLVPSAPGEQSFTSGAATLESSNSSLGYVMLNYNGKNPRVRFRVTTPAGINYTYFVTGYGRYVAYPLSGGSGDYKFVVYEAVPGQDNLYSTALSQSVSVTVADEFSPFLYPNYYVNFQDTSACVKKASVLAGDCAADLDVVSAVYHYVSGSVTYDNNKAKTVQSGYVPSPDATLAAGTGICFDYASLMSAMLRSQGIPTRLEVGYVGELYHAWISCYISEVGWVDGIIKFDGSSWTMMDPTLAAGSSVEKVREFLKDNIYSVKYSY